jgi:hypothetical protein
MTTEDLNDVIDGEHLAGVESDVFSERETSGAEAVVGGELVTNADASVVINESADNVNVVVGDVIEHRVAFGSEENEAVAVSGKVIEERGVVALKGEPRTHVRQLGIDARTQLIGGTETDEVDVKGFTEQPIDGVERIELCGDADNVFVRHQCVPLRVEHNAATQRHGGRLAHAQSAFCCALFAFRNDARVLNRHQCHFSLTLSHTLLPSNS